MVAYWSYADQARRVTVVVDGARKRLKRLQDAIEAGADPVTLIDPPNQAQAEVIAAEEDLVRNRLRVGSRGGRRRSSTRRGDRAGRGRQ